MPKSSFRLPLQSLVLAAGLFVAGGALAHVALVASTPAADSHVSSVDQLELTFDGALVPGASSITLSRVNRDQTLTPVDDVRLTHSNGNRTLRAVPAKALPQGDYQVDWRVVGGDDHPMAGRYRFMVH
ncbi:copper resistance protein CopC [Luteimonas sp BLCC-B24]|uniref:copper resistance protein CopC n=1 Tax=Luteimonas sp. BLCC-B24 TaxID=3025317 RepID=UPI00234CB5CD|nr:copper resistance protein CopC [Luteimonas sp. BLCC-B24]MDC7806329.1 copper resistance protein CopC [Luteimonas sp. BLCC-B24]